MHVGLAMLLMLTSALSQGDVVKPIVQDEPIANPSFVLVHTSDTRGYLEPCG